MAVHTEFSDPMSLLPTAAGGRLADPTRRVAARTPCGASTSSRVRTHPFVGVIAPIQSVFTSPQVASTHARRRVLCVVGLVQLAAWRFRRQGGPLACRTLGATLAVARRRAPAGAGRWIHDEAAGRRRAGQALARCRVRVDGFGGARGAGCRSVQHAGGARAAAAVQRWRDARVAAVAARTARVHDAHCPGGGLRRARAARRPPSIRRFPSDCRSCCTFATGVSFAIASRR